MRQFQNIVLAIAFFSACSVVATAQTGVRVVTAKASRTHSAPWLNDGSSYNKRVAPKDAPYNYKGNRALNPMTGTPNFSIAPGTILLDNRGQKRGEITAREVQLNYGGLRTIKGVDGKRSPHVNVFSTSLADGYLASGYAPLSAIQNKPIMPVINAKRPPNGATTPYTITGGTPSKFGVTNSKGQFIPFKVGKRVTNDGQSVDHHLVRPGGYVNEFYNLPGKGGLSFDSFKVGTTFHRSRAIHSIAVPFYHKGGTKQIGHLTFIYGSAGTKNDKHFGWMAVEALKRKR